MPDTIDLISPFLAEFENNPINVELVTDDGAGNITITFGTPPNAFSSGNELDYYSFQVYEIEYFKAVQFVDQTTGITYTVTSTEAPQPFTYTPDATTLVFAGATVSPPFGAVLQGTPSPCFAYGTEIATPDGPIAVQDLTPGAEVTTTTGSSRVVWLGHRRARDVDVVRIHRGALGATRDLVVSDDHALFVGGVLVPAGALVDGVGIVRERRTSVVLFHVELERHAILLAEGVQAESYIDTGNRRQFGNCPLTYDPISATQDHCAELVVAGERLERIRAELALVLA